MPGASDPEPDSANEASAPATERRGWTARVLPWVVAGAILGYLATQISVDQLGAAMTQTSLWLLLPLSTGFVLALLFADSLAMLVGFRAALPGSGIAMKPVLLMRGASYLLAIVNYGAGQGGIIYFLHRNHGVPLARAAGAVVLTAGAFVIVLSTVVGVGLLTGDVPDRPELRLVALTVVAAAPVYLGVVALRPAFLARWQLLRPFFDASVLGTLRIVAARGLHAVVLLAGHWLAMRVFGIDVPLDVALVRLPVLFVVGALPISPSGLGTTQAAAITLFASFAPGASEGARQAAVLAYSLSFHFACVAVSVAVGLVCLRALTSSVTEMTNTPPSDEANQDESRFDSAGNAP